MLYDPEHIPDRVVVALAFRTLADTADEHRAKMLISRARYAIDCPDRLWRTGVARELVAWLNACAAEQGVEA
jgi:hypothetical protein